MNDNLKRYIVVESIFDDDWGYEIIDTLNSGYIYYKNEKDELIEVEEDIEDNYVSNLGKCLFETDDYCEAFNKVSKLFDKISEPTA